MQTGLLATTKKGGMIAEISKAHALIREFRKLDPEITAQSIECFMLIATQEGTTAGAIAKKMAVPLSTASRHIYDWCQYNRYKKPGHNMVEQREVLADRRVKELYLTSRGQLFRASLLDILEK